MQPSWVPSPNPAGQNRRLIRSILRDWLAAASILGLDYVYPGYPPEVQTDAHHRATADHSAFVRIHIGGDGESRQAYTGPDDPGGKAVHWSATLLLDHLGYNADEWEQSEDDHDRIVDAIKDALRAGGRSAGRPEVILQLGEWPRDNGIATEYDPPVLDPAGVIRRSSRIDFTVTQYLRSPGDPS